MKAAQCCAVLVDWLFGDALEGLSARVAIFYDGGHPMFPAALLDDGRLLALKVAPREHWFFVTDQPERGEEMRALMAAAVPAQPA
jgi:hypothetical protein